MISFNLRDTWVQQEKPKIDADLCWHKNVLMKTASSSLMVLHAVNLRASNTDNHDREDIGLTFSVSRNHINILILHPTQDTAGYSHKMMLFCQGPFY